MSNIAYRPPEIQSSRAARRLANRHGVPERLGDHVAELSGLGSTRWCQPVAALAAQARERHRRDLVLHLHDLGPRAVGELLAELARTHGIRDDIDQRLERYGALDPRMVETVGGREWSKPPLHAVGAGR